MKPVAFRSIEEWHSALLTLPENSFFTLMRSVFGNIKTPFNKQKLIHDLTAFLSKKKIQETIKNFINEDDHRIIAAITILEEPFHGELESFFGGEYSYADLHNIILNLEERLIVYRFKDEGKSRLALNPVLAPILKAFTENTDILFPSKELSDSEKAERKFPHWNPSLLACIISFLYDQHDLIKAQGGIRKKNLDDCKRIFPDLNLEPVLGIFRASGLLQLDETGKHHIEEARLDQLAKLSDYERKVYLASSMMIFYEQGEILWQYFGKNRILTKAKKLHQFLQVLDTNHCYPRSTMHKIYELQEGKDIFFKGTTGKKFSRADMVLTILNSIGLLEEVEHDSWKIISAENKGTAPFISMDSPNSFIALPEIPFANAVKLARFSSIVETGTATRFMLTKDSVIRAYRLGITCDEIIATLKNLSGTYVDQNIIWQLKDWEKRYADVSLHTGVVLSLSKDRLYLASTEPLASMITETLAPGVFFLSVDNEEDAAEILSKAGVDIIARNNVHGNSKKVLLDNTQNFFPPLTLSSKLHTMFLPEDKKNYQSDIIIDEEKSDEQKDHFRTILAKMKISKDQRDELSARIERRLILTDEQMDESSIKFEKLEARGLDYVGKHNIAKQAISAESLLEVHCSDDNGTLHKILGVPSAIDKENGEAVLVMHTEKNDNSIDGTIRIALGKISLLRRIKQSIFGE
jgi:hypothetical protein